MGMQTTCGKAILLLMTLAHASAQTSVVSRAGWTGLENVYQTEMDTCCHAQRKRNTLYSTVPAEELEMYIGYGADGLWAYTSCSMKSLRENGTHHAPDVENVGKRHD